MKTSQQGVKAKICSRLDHISSDRSCALMRFYFRNKMQWHFWGGGGGVSSLVVFLWLWSWWKAIIVLVMWLNFLPPAACHWTITVRVPATLLITSSYSHGCCERALLTLSFLLDRERSSSLHGSLVFLFAGFLSLTDSWSVTAVKSLQVH